MPDFGEVASRYSSSVIDITATPFSQDALPSSAISARAARIVYDTIRQVGINPSHMLLTDELLRNVERSLTPKTSGPARFAESKALRTAIYHYLKESGTAAQSEATSALIHSWAPYLLDPNGRAPQAEALRMRGKQSAARAHGFLTAANAVITPAEV